MIVWLFACSDDPVYLEPVPGQVEINSPAGMGAPMASVIIPIRVENTQEAADRQKLADKLGLTLADVPQVRRDRIALSLEWTIKNLTDQGGRAEIQVVGANELFRYDPAVFVVDPEEDVEPPPLMGGAPILIPPRSSVSGVFHEGQLAEAAQDLDAITRGAITPEAAILKRWPTGDVTDDLGAVVLPSEIVASFLELDVSFTGNTHMVLEYVVRVRDKSDRLLVGCDPAALPACGDDTTVPPSSMIFTPAPPMMTP